MHSPTPILTNTNEARSLIELAAIPSLQDEEGQQPMPIYHSARSKYARLVYSWEFGDLTDA